MNKSILMRNQESASPWIDSRQSFLHDGVALYAMGPSERDAVLSKLNVQKQRTAYPCLTSREAAVLRDAIQSREKRSA